MVKTTKNKKLMPKACVHIQYVFVFYFYFPFIEFAYDNTLGICNSINFSLNIRTKRAQRPLSLIINYIYITIKYNIYIFFFVFVLCINFFKM